MAFVLIVEDSDTATPLEIALASLKGLRTMLVTNGRDALKLLRENHAEIAAVVTDLQLPYVDGFELIAAIRADKRSLGLPIVVVTGSNDPDNRLRVRELGRMHFSPSRIPPSKYARH